MKATQSFHNMISVSDILYLYNTQKHPDSLEALGCETNRLTISHFYGVSRSIGLFLFAAIPKIK